MKDNRPSLVIRSLDGSTESTWREVRAHGGGNTRHRTVNLREERRGREFGVHVL